MAIERVSNMQLDLELTAEHLDALARLLKGQAMFISRSRLSDNSQDLHSIENCLTGLAATISDLRGVAQNISKVA